MPRGVSATDSMQLAILTCQHADPQRRVQTKPYAEGPLKPQAQKCRRYQGSWGTLFLCTGGAEIWPLLPDILRCSAQGQV